MWVPACLEGAFPHQPQAPEPVHSLSPRPVYYSLYIHPMSCMDSLCMHIYILYAYLYIVYTPYILYRYICLLYTHPIPYIYTLFPVSHILFHICVYIYLFILARRSNQSILKEISPEYSLEGLMLKLKLQYFGYLM